MRIETKCIQEGYKPKNGEPRVLPIYQSTTYKYDSSEFVGKLFDLTEAGHIYSRISNPTLEAVEAKIAALEGGVAAMLTASGQAAVFFSIINICSAGDHVVCSSTIYGGSFNLFAVTLKRMGIKFTFIDPEASPEEIQKQILPETKCIYGEVLANPALNILDIEKFAGVAHKNNIPLIVDNTFPTPFLCRPFEFGADIVVHSVSKYMDGHAATISGVIVDSGKFDWTCGKFPDFTTPDDSYHGVVYTKNFGSMAYIAKARVQLMRDLGATLSPINAFMINQNIETLPLRMERHSQNAQSVAEYLESDSRISWVNYPGLKSSKSYELCKKYLPKGASGVVSFGVKGGRDAAMKFIDSLKLAALVVHVADARTSALHPASMTHKQMNDKQLLAAGITPDLIRFSVGIEHMDDIIEDIKQALDIACK